MSASADGSTFDDELLLLLDRDELDELLDRDDDELEDREEDDEELELLDELDDDDELDELDDELDADEELAEELLEPAAELEENPICVGFAGLPPHAASIPLAASAAPPESSSRNSRLAWRTSWTSSSGRLRSSLIPSPLPGAACAARPARPLRNTTRSAE